MELQHTVLFFFGLFTLVSSDVYYVTPSSSVPCPENLESPCLTLSQYANKSSDYFASNTTLILLPGNHCFTNGNLSLTKAMKYVAMLNSNGIKNKPTIFCQNGSHFKFQSMDRVITRGLTFIGCMCDIQSVSDFVIDNCTFTKSSDSALSISKSAVTIRKSFIKDNNVTHEDLVQCKNSQIMFEKSVLSNNTIHRTYNVIMCYDTNLTLTETMFYGNSYRDVNVGYDVGQLLGVLDTNLIIQNSIFSNNLCIQLVVVYSANEFHIYSSEIHVYSSEFIQNSCSRSADNISHSSLIVTALSDLFVDNTSFIENGACNFVNEFKECVGFSFFDYSVIIGSERCTNHSVVIKNSLYKSNYNMGMLSVVTYCTLSCVIENITFEHNKLVNATYGSLISVYFYDPLKSIDFPTSGLITVNSSTFSNNSYFGAIDIRSISPNSTVIITALFKNTFFDHNKLKRKSSNLIFVQGAVYVKANGIQFSHNQGIRKLFYIVNSDVYITNSKFLANCGSFSASSSNVTFMGLTTFNQNYAKTSDEGGALTCLQSDIAFFDNGTLTNNYAEYYGGGVLATECRISALGELKVTNNTANVSGGGIFVVQGEINIRGENVEIANNQARVNGGGIYATGSTVKVFKNSFVIENNTAGENGGGCYLEHNSRLYVIKNQCEEQDADDNMIQLKLLNNSADVGGAVYVDDETGLCVNTDASYSTQSRSNSWCFLQVISTYTPIYPDEPCEATNYRNVYFIDNKARSKGHDIYGGLLDRCTVSPYAELIKDSNFTSLTGKSYLENISNINLSTSNSKVSAVTSDAVRVCFCKSNKLDCNYHPPVNAWKGENSTISALAVDQIEIPLSATIRSYLSENSTNTGPSTQKASSACTDLTFNILSSLRADKVYLYADGPCGYDGISKQYFNITFLPCPIGFCEVKDMKYHTGNCECDPQLAKYINCSVESGAVQRISGSNSWIMYSDSDGFVTYEHCPFDFCYPPSENANRSLNFSIINSLCALSRTGKLCGSCKDSLSLTLGSSQCKPCSNCWLSLLIPFALGGIVLVAFLLVCNLTTAVGTINGLIFYANIVVASPATFFPYKFQKPVFLHTFISWLNLDLGIEACFFNGMDAYIYTWLQLAFPLYVIFLVVAVIILSEYSGLFARLVSKGNPVATLATLILLSYAKLLRLVIDISLPAVLQHIDLNHTTETVWLIDGNVPYLKGKHIGLFTAAIVIMILVLIYTIFLFSWQWFVYTPHWRIFNWVENEKLKMFMETYHAPFKPKYRYWTGVLLITRIVLYVIMAFNIHGDVKANLLAIILVSFCLVALVKGVYKNWIIGSLEMTFLLNLGMFAAATSYVKDSNANQIAVSYISIGVTFLLLCAILMYHIYAFILKKKKVSVCQTNRALYKILEDSNDSVQDTEPLKQNNFREPLNLITETLNTDDYRQAAASHRPNPVVTQAVIEGRPRGEMLNPQLLQLAENEEQDQ